MAITSFRIMMGKALLHVPWSGAIIHDPHGFRSTRNEDNLVNAVSDDQLPLHDLIVDAQDSKNCVILHCSELVHLS